MRKIFVLVLIALFAISFVSAKSIGIDFDKQSVVPGQEVKIKMTLYEGSEKLQGQVAYGIYDTYEELVTEGVVESGREINFVPNKNSLEGYWTVIAEYQELNANRLFKVDVLEEADFILEGDNLIIRNIGNTEYDKQVLITIGENEEVIEVLLGIGQEKKLKLVAPDGVYDVQVSDGSEENTIQRSGVSLTGNVIGIEDVVDKSFLARYPLVMVFIGLLIGMSVFVSYMKIKKKLGK